jgi:hypothetical protein
MLVAFISLLAMPLRAELVENLYQANLIVSDRLVDPDDASLRSGLKRVLVKVSGTTRASSIVDEFVSDPERYVNMSHFESTHQVHTDVDGNDYLAQRLLLGFEQQAVDDLLRNQKLLPLGKYRPRVLVWMLGDENKILSRLKEDLQLHAKQIAFPITLLMAEKHGLSRLQNETLLESVSKSSLSYSKALVVVIFLDVNNVVHWSVVDDPSVNKIKWQFSTGDFSEQLTLAFDAWIESSGMKIDSAKNLNVNSHQIIVTRVKNMADYAAVMEYVRSLPSIRLSKVASMSNQTLTLVIQSQLDGAGLSRLLGLDKRMLFMRSLQGEEVDGLLRWSWFGTRGR